MNEIEYAIEALDQAYADGMEDLAAKILGLTAQWAEAGDLDKADVLQQLEEFLEAELEAVLVEEGEEFFDDAA